MLKKVIFCALLALASANLDTKKFAKRESEVLVPENKEEFIKEVSGGRRSRISNGDDASDIAYPYAVDITTRWPNGARSICTGAILSTSYIITSRTCIL